MPARETEAIILKTFPLGEADRLLVHLASAPELAEILDDWEAPR